MHPSQKLLHRQLSPFVVEWRIGPMAYYLKLLYWMKQLHSVFNVVKLTPAPDNPITGRKMEDHYKGTAYSSLDNLVWVSII